MARPTAPTTSSKCVSGESPTLTRGISVESQLVSSHCLSGHRLLALSVHGRLYLPISLFDHVPSRHTYIHLYTIIWLIAMCSQVLSPFPLLAFPQSITNSPHIPFFCPRRKLSPHYPSSIQAANYHYQPTILPSNRKTMADYPISTAPSLTLPLLTSTVSPGTWKQHGFLQTLFTLHNTIYFYFKQQ